MVMRLQLRHKKWLHTRLVAFLLITMRRWTPGWHLATLPSGFFERFMDQHCVDLASCHTHKVAHFSNVGLGGS